LLAYMALLLKWSKAYNLIRSDSLDNFVSRHLLDSLAVPGELLQGEIMDFGSGGGLPGIPLAIAYPDKTFLLVDSNGKKVRFLEQVRIELKLTNMTTLHDRVENLRNLADTIVVRAVSQLQTLWQQAGGPMREGGRMLAMKAVLDETEMSPVRACCEQVIPLTVWGLTAERHLICLKSPAKEDGSD